MKKALLQATAMFALAPMLVFGASLEVILAGIQWLLNANEKGAVKIVDFVELSDYL